MLKISKKADYGMMALMHLAQHPDRNSWSAREIAERYGIPLELMAKILQKLVQKGFLVSHHGTNEGYSLARSADAISVAQLLSRITIAEMNHQQQMDLRPEFLKEGPFMILKDSSHEATSEADCPV